eukprot:682058-Karenia_brevis.AAC.1
MAGASRPRGGVGKTKLRADDEPNLSRINDTMCKRKCPIKCVSKIAMQGVGHASIVVVVVMPSTTPLFWQSADGRTV